MSLLNNSLRTIGHLTNLDTPSIKQEAFSELKHLAHEAQHLILDKAQDSLQSMLKANPGHAAIERLKTAGNNLHHDHLDLGDIWKEVIKHPHNDKHHAGDLVTSTTAVGAVDANIRKVEPIDWITKSGFGDTRGRDPGSQHWYKGGHIRPNSESTPLSNTAKLKMQPDTWTPSFKTNLPSSMPIENASTPVSTEVIKNVATHNSALGSLERTAATSTQRAAANIAERASLGTSQRAATTATERAALSALEGEAVAATSRAAAGIAIGMEGIAVMGGGGSWKAK